MRLAVKGAPRSVLGMTCGIHDFRTILPTQERRRIENRLRNECDEYYDEVRGQWHADLIYAPEEANREANARHRYRLFTFSNFFTTIDMVATLQENIEDILADAHAGSVLLMIGAKGRCYPAIQKRIARLADAAGFQRRIELRVRAGNGDHIQHRLDEEVRCFYGELMRLAGSLPTNEPCTAGLRKELESNRLIGFKSSTVHAFRK